MVWRERLCAHERLKQKTMNIASIRLDDSWNARTIFFSLSHSLDLCKQWNDNKIIINTNASNDSVAQTIPERWHTVAIRFCFHLLLLSLSVWCLLCLFICMDIVTIRFAHGLRDTPNTMQSTHTHTHTRRRLSSRNNRIYWNLLTYAWRICHNRRLLATTLSAINHLFYYYKHLITIHSILCRWNEPLRFVYFWLDTLVSRWSPHNPI